MAAGRQPYNGGGSKDHLSSSVPADVLLAENYGQEHEDDGNRNTFPIALAVVLAIILLIRFLYYDCRTGTEEQEARGGDTVTGTAAMEMAPPVRVAVPPLVCTYRKEEGMRESSCGVCLADLDDGDVVRVLPACMHYFHAACVGKWLRIHATCPFCRALLVAPADATT